MRLNSIIAKTFFGTLLGGAILYSGAQAKAIDVSEVVNAWINNTNISQSYNNNNNNRTNNNGDIAVIYSRNNAGVEKETDSAVVERHGLKVTFPDKNYKTENVKVVTLHMASGGQGGPEEEDLFPAADETVDANQNYVVNDLDNNGSENPEVKIVVPEPEYKAPAEEIPQVNLEQRIDSNMVFELLDVVAGDYSPAQKVKLENLVNQREAGINLDSERGNAILSTSEQYLDYVIQVADEMGIPYVVMAGIMTLENGGGIDKVSPSNCVGLFQFARRTEKSMKKYANRRIGYEKYNPSKDDRKNPYISTELAGWLLKYEFEKFGRWDFAIQAYHDGDGYLGERISRYVRKNYGEKIGRNDNIAGVIEKYDIKLVDIVGDSSINFTKEARRYYSGVICLLTMLAERRNEFADNKF